MAPVRPWLSPAWSLAQHNCISSRCALSLSQSYFLSIPPATLLPRAGDIDFAEFVTLMAHKMADEKSEATLKAAFSVFDTSGDGFISAEEMRRIMINVGEPVTLDDVEQVIRKVDIDGDGVINYDEFTKVIIEEKATQFGQSGGK